MTVTLIQGDCREVLPTLEAESVDSCVCDPPYHLTSIVKRFGSATAAPARSNGATGVYARASAGFMGQHWDGGDVAFRPETWAEVLRVLKPGAHLVAFGGTRTYHRMVCAIEDAGFEIRDQIGWLYGSGFPKSHDIGKAIDKRGGASIAWFGPWLRAERERRGITQKSLAAHFPSKTGQLTGCVANWELGFNLPTPEQFNTLCAVMDLPFDRIDEAERAVIGNNNRPAGWFTTGDGHDITAPATDAAKQWDGWGTALKPAWEPIVLARKPLSEPTVAANVLRWGTGALNIDGCRITTDENLNGGTYSGTPAKETSDGWRMANAKREFQQPAGRWPANIAHDGSDEVLEAFAAFGSDKGQSGHLAARNSDKFRNTYGDFAGTSEADFAPHDERGTAARFFFSSKASRAERDAGLEGSPLKAREGAYGNIQDGRPHTPDGYEYHREPRRNTHPTVKPIALMQWLCRLVTPPGGTVLDPFLGSGTTAIAAAREGFPCIGIELSPDYLAIARRRIAGDAPLLTEVA